jgi:hypothetical protein
MPAVLRTIFHANTSASTKMPAQNKSLQLSAKVVILKEVTPSRQEQVLGF